MPNINKNSFIAHNLTFDWPDGTRVFDRLNFSIPNKRVGLVGRNGTGKTSLLRLLIGELIPTSGKIECIGRVAIVPQNRLSVVAMGTVSGGEAVRLHLATALRLEPDLLILDEPTNDLDQEGWSQIQGLIATWKSSLLVVSHDPDVLSQLDEIWELSSHGLKAYGGNYQFYLDRCSEELAARMRIADSLQTEKRKLARKACETKQRQEKRQMRGRQAALKSGIAKMQRGILQRRGERTAGKLNRVHEKRLADSSAALREARSKLANETILHIDLPKTRVPEGKCIMDVQQLNLSHQTNGNWLWQQPLDWTLHGSRKVCVQGPNACGKSSLLKALAGARFEQQRGMIRLHVEASYLDQQVSIVVAGRSLLDQLRGVAPSLSETEMRIRLARFLFPNDRAFLKGEQLSGGERMRAGLLLTFCREPAPQLLLLDEPTNNLDIESREHFVQALNLFKGAVICVSHDSAFVNSLNPDMIFDLDKMGLQAR